MDGQTEKVRRLENFGRKLARKPSLWCRFKVSVLWAIPTLNLHHINDFLASFWLKFSGLLELLQENGVVERKNRILEEMARTMLCDNNLPRYF